MKLYTVGHSNHSLERFVELVTGAGWQAVVDVRTAPSSRFNPQFNKGSLEAALPAAGVEYYFAGKFLGGRPSDPTCYKRRTLPPEGADYLHEVDYPEVMKRDWFVKGIQRLLEIADERATAVMCSEEDPATCHRHHLIAKYLLREHPEVSVFHLRGDGVLVNAATLHVAVDQAEGQQMSLFGPTGDEP
jgi:uncharacterized protein (DUF488 family)